MRDAQAATITVRVVYAEPGWAFVRDLQVPAGSTAMQVVQGSGLRQQRPQLVLTPDCLGVFGQRVDAQRVLHDGDRVEVYRPLRVDPMQARRQRAVKSADR